MEGLEEAEITSEVETMRHSCAHVMAHAVSRLWPQAKFGIGPTVENGFYYDIALDVVLTPEDLKKIEKTMDHIIRENKPFVRQEHPVDEAIAMFEKMGQPFKVEIIKDLQTKFGAKTVSTYSEGEFTDLCRGPHVEKPSKIKAYKLTSIAGAYWRGSEKNPQLQRIYGVAFLSKEELAEYVHFLEEAKKRDHRKLGKELDLFSFQPVGPAMPFIHPKGMVVYNKLRDYVRALNFKYGFDEILTPQILDAALWKKSGHYDNYKENMFFTEVDEREFAIKPMSCPGACMVYGNSKYSYRDLPLRMAEFGFVHRYERSGVTAGMTRVRGFCQDDAHLYVTPEQIESEIGKIVRMILDTYKLFDFSDVKIFLSTRPTKRVGDDSLWDQAEAALKSTLDTLGHPYTVNPGDGAFYGPKIDFVVRDALKRGHQLGTIQLDFNLPERFDLNYTGADNAAHRPVMIHRAVLGSLERFFGILIEHTGGAFPFWLAPVQARIVPVSDAQHDFARTLRDEMRALGFRAELDDRNESMGYKTREAQKAKIPFMLVIGEREVQANEISMRKYGEQATATLPRAGVFELFQGLNDVSKHVTGLRA
ncbi:MAG: threonine--tRNA ligase [Bdellovibrionales bacterium]|nr:threonine--tRNA ligase [Bdellovibrionales bacterium]